MYVCFGFCIYRKKKTVIYISLKSYAHKSQVDRSLVLQMQSKILFYKRSINKLILLLFYWLIKIHVVLLFRILIKFRRNTHMGCVQKSAAFILIFGQKSCKTKITFQIFYHNFSNILNIVQPVFFCLKNFLWIGKIEK